MMSVTVRDVQKLFEHRAQPCVSVYMSTDPVSPGGPEDRARLRNLLRDAATRLARVHHADAVEGLLGPVVEKVQRAWPPRGRGIALLRSPDLNVGFELPVEVPDVAVVAPTFHTKPLLSFLDRNQRYLVLALGARSVRLLEGSAAGLADVTADALAPELTAAPAGAGRRWYAALDEAVRGFLGADEAPLVLAGAHERQEAYRAAAVFPRLLEGGIHADVDRLEAGGLHEEAWPIVCADQAEVERQAALHWLSFRGAGMATDVLSEVMEAAADGRVRLLLHREGTHLWGRMDPARGTFVLRAGEAELEPGDSDLIDDLCELTLVRGGDVVEVAAERMPTDVPVAAILRY
jgi:hypothetical protein